MPNREREEKRKDPEAILWLAANRSALTQVADTCECTTQFVSLVLYGRRRSKDGKVERMLRQMGAPIR